MKVKFTKLAALLLAGAALFAAGCTDYEVDIQKVDQKVDNLTADVNGKISSLESQIAGINATIATLEKAADHNADIQKVNKAISDLQDALNADIKQLKDRVKAIEDADFQSQINDLTTKYNDLEAKKADKSELQKVEADLRQLIEGEISKLDTRLKAAEAAIEDLTKEPDGVIPTLKKQVADLEAFQKEAAKKIKDLEDGKLDKKDFDAYYQEAYKKYTKAVIDEMQSAIQDLADTKLDKSVYDAKMKEIDKEIADIIAKFDDYVLTSTFEAFVKIAATKAELEAVRAELDGRLKACEDLLAGDWGDDTVKQYIDKAAQKLQGQIDEIVNEKLPALDQRISALEDTVNNTILPEIQFAIGYEGYYADDEWYGELYDGVSGLEAYIMDWAIDAYESSIAYTDYEIETLWETIVYYLDDIYNKLDMALQRIQSIQFVPTHDDLKITTNMAYVYQPVADEREVAVSVVDQPTQVTYQFLPAQYAGMIAREIKENIIRWEEAGIGGYTRDELKASGGYDGLIAFFDVRPVETRDGETATENAPEFKILSVDSYSEDTGEITFTILPVNVASANFAAAGMEPNYEYGLVSNGYYVTGWEEWYPYSATGIFAADDPDRYSGWYDILKVGVWKAEDLETYQARSAYAAQLRLYRIQDWDYAWDSYPDYRESYDLAGHIDYDGDDYVDYENELASPYNVLYPAVTEIEVLPDPFKKEPDGSVRPFMEDEIYQTLPYSSLREGGVDAEGKTVTPNIGEKESQDPKGYRIILDQAVPVVSIDGGDPMTIEAATKAGYVIPPIETTFKEFTYEDESGAELTADEQACFVPTEQVYAEIEMNPKKSASTRKMEVGDNITGTYEFKSEVGSFFADGYVRITKPEGEVSVSAAIQWVYAQDADTDHAVYYEGADPKYTHVAEPVTIGDDAATLKETLGIELADFDHKEPISVTIEPAGLVIENVTITEDGLVADFVDFEWGKTYTVKAVYELDAAEVTVNGTITTTYRNDEMPTIELSEYAFVLNGDDYDEATDTYTSEIQEFQQNLFDVFTSMGIINQGTVKDFEDADAFIGVETNGKEGHLEVVPADKLEDDEENSSNILIADDNATVIATSAELKDIFEKGEALVIYVTTYIGQKVKIVVPVTVDLPGYDFLHLRFYTFNKDEEVANFITKRNFADNDGTVKWWSQVNPSYFTEVDAAAVPGDVSDRVSYRHALADYDVAYINLAELAFNVVDENDDIMEEDEIEEANLVVNFDYTVEGQGLKPLPTVDQITNFEKYEDLWVDDTVFYYRTNEKKFIPAKGTLAILSGEVEFPLPTRFDTPKNSVKNPEVALDYSTYAVVRWTPFQAPKADGYTIVLDENKIYSVPLFKGMELKDNRPNGVSYYVIKDGEWVEGNVTTFDPESSTPPAGGNGYINGIKANEAYHITTTFEYSDLELPVDLKKLLTVEVIDNVPTLRYDYRSQVGFHGVITIPVTVTLENPWQEAIKFEYNVIIKGVGD